MLPTINIPIQTNYSIEENNFEFLETMVSSIKRPRILLFFSISPESGMLSAAMNKLKKDARNKYGDNIGLINLTAVKRNNYTLITFPFGLWYNEELVISADIIRFSNKLSE